MIYFRLCFSFSCSDYDLTLIKKSHALNFYSLFLLLVAGVTQFTAKTTNSEKVIYFLSLISCSINKLKSHILFICKSFNENFVFQFNVEKKYLAPVNDGGAGAILPPLSQRPCQDIWRDWVHGVLLFLFATEEYCGYIKANYSERLILLRTESHICEHAILIKKHLKMYLVPIPWQN